MTRFVRVQVAGSYADDEVLTKEGYDELKQKISERLERLESRIAAIEKPLEENKSAKTFIFDDYQVTIMDNGGVSVLMDEYGHLKITYNPDNKEKPWTQEENYPKFDIHKIINSQNIMGLELTSHGLKSLYKALKVVSKQYLMDNEIVF